MRSRRGLGVDSNHFLVREKILARNSCQKSVRSEQTPRWNTDVFENPNKKREYQEVLATTTQELMVKFG